MSFSSLGNSDHASVSIEFSWNSQWYAPLNCIDYDYFHVDWDGVHEHLRDVPREDVFRLAAFAAAASEFCEWVQVGIDVYIPHLKCHVKPHSYPWFSATFAAAIVHRNHFFRVYQQNKSSESKVKFSQASHCCKRVLEVVKRAYVNKTKESMTS